MRGVHHIAIAQRRRGLRRGRKGRSLLRWWKLWFMKIRLSPLDSAVAFVAGLAPHTHACNMPTVHTRKICCRTRGRGGRIRGRWHAALLPRARGRKARHWARDRSEWERQCQLASGSRRAYSPLWPIRVRRHVPLLKDLLRHTTARVWCWLRPGRSALLGKQNPQCLSLVCEAGPLPPLRPQTAPVGATLQRKQVYYACAPPHRQHAMIALAAAATSAEIHVQQYNSIVRRARRALLFYSEYSLQVGHEAPHCEA